MIQTRKLFLALLTGATLLASGASQATTIFERFAPPLLPIPVPVPVPNVRIEAPARVEYYDDYDRRDYRYERRHYRHDHRRDWRDERRYDRYDRYDRHDWRRDHGYRR